MQTQIIGAIRTLSSSVSLWDHQREALEKLITLLEGGGTRGLIKHPTGAGKTTLFCSIAKAIELPTLILVPRTGLLDQVYETLIKVGVSEDFILSSATYAGSVESMLQTRGAQHIFLMTYQGLLSLRRMNPDLYSSFHESISLLIADEGHTALGAKTRNAVVGNVEDTQDALEDEEEVGDILDDFSCLELFITATPVLLNKNVQEIYGVPIIDYIRYENLAKKGVLIVPQIKSPGKAVLNMEEEDFPTSQAGLDKISHRFLMEDGRTVQEALMDLYLTEYDKAGGYLPGVVFCSDIASAEAFMVYARSLRPSLRLIRCTGGNEEYALGVSLEEAKEFIEKGGDLVVTVDKAGLGWDVPTLRASLVTVPLFSSARYLQGPVGRIGRSLKDSRFPEKRRENTMIFEPEWFLEKKGTLSTESTSDTPSPCEESKESSQPEGVFSPVRRALFHGYHHLYEQGELSKEAMLLYFGEEVFEQMPTALWSTEEWKVHLKKELSEEKLLSMKNSDALAWKDPMYGFGLHAAITKVGGVGNPISNTKDRLLLGILLHGEDSKLMEALTDQKEERLPLPNWTEEQWKEHLKKDLSVEKLLTMNAKNAESWKDPVYGFGLVSAMRNVGGVGNPVGYKKVRLHLGILLHGEDPRLMEALKKEGEALPNWTEEEWKVHLKEVLSVEKLLSMKHSDALAWKDLVYGFGLRAANTKVGGVGNPLSNARDRLLLGILLHGEDPRLMEPLETEGEALPNWTKEEWKEHLKEDLSVEKLLSMKTLEARAWKDPIYRFGLLAANTKVGGVGDPGSHTKVRLRLGILLHGEDPLLLSALKDHDKK